MKYFDDIKAKPLERKICFILYMLFFKSLCKSFRESLGFSCYNSVVARAFHPLSSSAIYSWKFAFVLMRWTPPSCFRKSSVLVVGDLVQLFGVILGMFSPPTMLKEYALSKFQIQVRAFLSYSPMHSRYAVYRENASSMNSLLGGWDITFAIHLGSPHII